MYNVFIGIDEVIYYCNRLLCLNMYSENCLLKYLLNERIVCARKSVTFLFWVQIVSPKQ